MASASKFVSLLSPEQTVKKVSQPRPGALVGEGRIAGGRSSRGSGSISRMRAFRELHFVLFLKREASGHSRGASGGTGDRPRTQSRLGVVTSPFPKVHCQRRLPRITRSGEGVVLMCKPALLPSEATVGFRLP